VCRTFRQHAVYKIDEFPVGIVEAAILAGGFLGATVGTGGALPVSVPTPRTTGEESMDANSLAADVTRTDLDLIESRPALEAAGRRNTQEYGRQESLLALEAAIESSRRSTIVLDAHGGLLWVSKRARGVFGWTRGAKAALPEAIREAALELGAAFAGNETTARPTSSLKLVGLDGGLVAVDLRSTRTDAGVPVVVAEIHVAGQQGVADLAARFKLTAAQAAVLMSLTQGCSDRAIADRHSVSIATVRSHLSKVLSKLGVESRLQAALLAARSSTTFSERITPHSPHDASCCRASRD